MSSSSERGKARVTIRDVVWLGIFAAIMFGGQVVMSPLPNIEPVSLFVIVGTLVFGWKILFSVYVFALLEGFMYGFGFWFPCYLYIWDILVVLTMIFRKEEGRLVWAVISGGFGLFFGLFFEVPFLFIIGVPATVAYYISGIPYDLIHAAGNFVIAFVALPPLVRVVRRLYDGTWRTN